MNLNLPEYNMGYNKNEWMKIANSKVISDVGNIIKTKKIKITNIN
jgi:hypothetical protein